jgi:hypothetical protein
MEFLERSCPICLEKCLTGQKYWLQAHSCFLIEFFWLCIRKGRTGLLQIYKLYKNWMCDVIKKKSKIFKKFLCLTLKNRCRRTGRLMSTGSTWHRTGYNSETNSAYRVLEEFSKGNHGLLQSGMSVRANARTNGAVLGFEWGLKHA